MSISTNSVIHYTDRIDHLKGIIECQGFRLKYCLEDLDIENQYSIAFPMVSFCDIPLSEIKKHIDTYGSYGIGLSKSWAKRTGLNPVLYIEKSSRISKALNGQGDRLIKLMDDEKMDHDSLNEFFAYLGYCKNYEGRLVRGKINTDSYRFYDEREWRFVAQGEDIPNADDLVDGDNYSQDKALHNDKIKDCLIKFSFSDISYIIVDNEDEIPEILKVLNDTFEDNITSKELKILSTKLLTKHQIWNDF